MKTVLIVKDALAPWSKGGGEDRYSLLASQHTETDLAIKFASMKWWEGDAPADHIAISRLIPMYGKNRTRSKFQAIYFAISTLKILPLKPDLIEADQAPILQIFPIWLVSRLLRIPFTCTVHEYWGKEYWLENYGFIGHIGWRLEYSVLKLPDVVIVPSKLTSRRISLATKNRISPVTIQNETLLPKKSDIKTTLRISDILYVGRLIEHKRVDLVILTFQKLLKNFSGLHLGIVGTGPEGENLRKQAKYLLPEDSYTFYGVIENKIDVLALILQCQIFISPSEREGFGISVLEALQLGKYVLISNSEDNASVEFASEYPNLYISASQDLQGYEKIASQLLRAEPYVRLGPGVALENQLAHRYAKVWKSLL